MSLRLDGALNAEDQAALGQHLVACPDCRQLWAQMQAVSAVLARSSFVAPGPGFSARVMAHIRREQRRVALLRTGGIVLLSALIVGAIAVVPLATFVNVGIHNPAVVHALLNAGLWFVDIGRTLAGATQAVLRALVLGLSWPVVVGYLMIAVAMLLTWVRVVARPVQQRAAQRA
jgi:predicted anti-sigma-YlaC factor YlaD